MDVDSGTTNDDEEEVPTVFRWEHGGGKYSSRDFNDGRPRSVRKSPAASPPGASFNSGRLTQRGVLGVAHEAS